MRMSGTPSPLTSPTPLTEVPAMSPGFADDLEAGVGVGELAEEGGLAESAAEDDVDAAGVVCGGRGGDQEVAEAVVVEVADVVHGAAGVVVGLGAVDREAALAVGDRLEGDRGRAQRDLDDRAREAVLAVVDLVVEAVVAPQVGGRQVVEGAVRRHGQAEPLAVIGSEAITTRGSPSGS
jgi:hypothetical protein